MDGVRFPPQLLKAIREENVSLFILPWPFGSVCCVLAVVPPPSSLVLYTYASAWFVALLQPVASDHSLISAAPLPKRHGSRSSTGTSNEREGEIETNPRQFVNFIRDPNSKWSHSFDGFALLRSLTVRRVFWRHCKSMIRTETTSSDRVQSLRVLFSSVNRSFLRRIVNVISQWVL